MTISILFGATIIQIHNHSEEFSKTRLFDFANDLLDSITYIITEQSSDGKRYLYTDWQNCLNSKKELFTNWDLNFSFAIKIRILNLNDSMVILEGSLDNCSTIVTSSKSILAVEDYLTRPAELIVLVGK